MSFELSSCLEGSVLVHDDGNCFKTIESGYNDFETCYVNVLVDCMLDVRYFSLESDWDYLWLGNSESWTGENGPDYGKQVYGGDEFKLTTDYSQTDIGFDICCITTPSPTSDEIYDLRGGDTMEGNVYLNGQPFCDNNWDNEDANVVCRILGFDYGEAICCSSFGEVNGNFINSEFYCDGGESTIWDCQHSATSACDQYQAAGAYCFYDDENGEEFEYVYLAPIIICVFCCVVCCCWLWCKHTKPQQHNTQGEIHGTVGQSPEIRVGDQSPTGTSNGVAIERTNTHNVIRPARQSYQPTRNNTFHDYNRPKFDSNADGQIEGASSQGVNVTTYEASHGTSGEAIYLELVAPKNGASASFAPPPPAWTPTPGYATPAYEPPSY